MIKINQWGWFLLITGPDLFPVFTVGGTGTSLQAFWPLRRNLHLPFLLRHFTFAELQVVSLTRVFAGSHRTFLGGFLLISITV